MKKASLIIACAGIVSITAFGSVMNNSTDPQDNGKKTEAQVAPKKDAAGNPIEVARPVQAVAASTDAPAQKEVKATKVTPAESQKTPSKPVKRGKATEKTEPASVDKIKK